MRKMAVDLGDVRIGIAMSDSMAIIASPYETYNTKSNDEDIDYIISVAKKNSCDTIVVGYPINMDGTLGPRAIKSQKFVEALKAKIDIKIVLQDERLSSQTAERYLIEAEMRREKRKTVIDKVAACVILRQYLERI